jgi:hypothetical protein
MSSQQPQQGGYTAAQAAAYYAQNPQAYQYYQVSHVTWVTIPFVARMTDICDTECCVLWLACLVCVLVGLV